MAGEYEARAPNAIDAGQSIEKCVTLNGDVNGDHGTESTLRQPGRQISLRVVIVGAGIGGLTAAIALRRQGHEVVVSIYLDGTLNKRQD